MVFDRLCGHGEDKLRHQFAKWDRRRGSTRTLSAFNGHIAAYSDASLSAQGGGVRMLMSTLLYESLCPLLYYVGCHPSLAEFGRTNFFEFFSSGLSPELNTSTLGVRAHRSFPLPAPRRTAAGPRPPLGTSRGIGGRRYGHKKGVHFGTPHGFPQCFQRIAFVESNKPLFQEYTHKIRTHIQKKKTHA